MTKLTLPHITPEDALIENPLNTYPDELTVDALQEDQLYFLQKLAEELSLPDLNQIISLVGDLGGTSREAWNQISTYKNLALIYTLSFFTISCSAFDETPSKEDLLATITALSVSATVQAEEALEDIYALESTIHAQADTISTLEDDLGEQATRIAKLSITPTPTLPPTPIRVPTATLLPTSTPALFEDVQDVYTSEEEEAPINSEEENPDVCTSPGDVVLPDGSCLKTHDLPGIGLEDIDPAIEKAKDVWGDVTDAWGRAFPDEDADTSE